MTASSRLRAEAPAIASIVGVLALLYLDVLAEQATFALEDFLAWYLPTRLIVLDALRHGMIPLWDFSTSLGVALPFTPTSAATVLYPGNVLMLGGDPVAGVHRFIVAHLMWGALGMFALLRHLGVRRALAAAAAIAFATSGPITSYAEENPFNVVGLAWIPWGWWAWRLGGWLGLLLSGAALSQLILGGDPQQGYLHHGVLLFAVVFEAGRDRRRLAIDIGRLALVGVLALLLAAPQLLAVVLALGEQGRGAGIDLLTRQVHSVHPWRLLQHLLPFANGTFVPRYSMWGLDRYRPWFVTLYCGFIPLMVWGMAAGWARADRRAWGRASGWTVVLAVALELGRHTPIHGLVDRLVPGLSLFRYPEKWAAGIALAAPILAGLGLEHALRFGRGRGLAMRAGALAATGVAAWVAAPSLRPVIEARAGVPHPALPDLAIASLQSDAVALVALAVGVALAGVVLRERPRLGLGLLVAILALDCVRLVPASAARLPRGAATDHGPIAERLLERGREDRFRRAPFIPSMGFKVTDGHYTDNIARAQQTGGLYHWRGVLGTPYVHGLGASVRDHKALLALLDGPNPLDGGALLGTRYVVLADESPPEWAVAGAGAGRLRHIATEDALRAAVAEDTGARPRAGRLAAYDFERESWLLPLVGARLRAMDLDRAVVDADETLFGGALVSPAPPMMIPPGRPSAGPAVPVEGFQTRDHREIRFTTRGDRPGLVVTADLFTPGWRAWVNDTEVPIRRAEHLLMAVEVPAGEARVRLLYTHPGLEVGLWVGALVWLVWLAGTVRLARRRRGRPLEA